MRVFVPLVLIVFAIALTRFIDDTVWLVRHWRRRERVETIVFETAPSSARALPPDLDMLAPIGPPPAPRSPQVAVYPPTEITMRRQVLIEPCRPLIFEALRDEVERRRAATVRALRMPTAEMRAVFDELVGDHSRCAWCIDGELAEAMA